MLAAPPRPRQRPHRRPTSCRGGRPPVPCDVAPARACRAPPLPLSHHFIFSGSRSSLLKPLGWLPSVCRMLQSHNPACVCARGVAQGAAAAARGVLATGGGLGQRDAVPGQKRARQIAAGRSSQVQSGLVWCQGPRLLPRPRPDDASQTSRESGQKDVHPGCTFPLRQRHGQQRGPPPPVQRSSCCR